jgi:hypothetical protein
VRSAMICARRTDERLISRTDGLAAQIWTTMASLTPTKDNDIEFECDPQPPLLPPQQASGASPAFLATLCSPGTRSGRSLLDPRICGRPNSPSIASNPGACRRRCPSDGLSDPWVHAAGAAGTAHSLGADSTPPTTCAQPVNQSTNQP